MIITERKCECVRASGFTRDLHPLNSLSGVVGDMDINTDGLTMVVQLERDRDWAVLVSHQSNNTSMCKSYLLIQWDLQVKRSVRHQEATAGLPHRLWTWLLWGVLNLADHQMHRVPTHTQLVLIQYVHLHRFISSIAMIRAAVQRKLGITYNKILAIHNWYWIISCQRTNWSVSSL